MQKVIPKIPKKIILEFVDFMIHIIHEHTFNYFGRTRYKLSEKVFWNVEHQELSRRTWDYTNAEKFKEFSRWGLVNLIDTGEHRKRKFQTKAQAKNKKYSYKTVNEIKFKWEITPKGLDILQNTTKNIIEDYFLDE